jgi:flagellar biosynthesis protein FlhA
LTTAACIVAAMALVPGMPKVQFLLLAAGTALLGRMATKAEKTPPKQTAAQKKKPEKEPVEELLDVDRVSVHVGVRLIGMVDPRKSNAIFDRIGALRRQFAQQMGIIIPLVRLRDDLNLEPNAYEIRLSEVPVAKGFLEPELFLAMDAGAVREKVDGIKTTEPVYGLPALWITTAKKEAAELSGYTVIDPESVFITHLSETLKRHADELLTREDVQLLIDRLRKNQPSLVGEVVGTEGEVSAGLLQRVLRNLLRSGLPIRELTAILEALAENAGKTKNAATLTEVVRKSLSRTITEQYRDTGGKMTVIAFDPPFEHQLTAWLRQEGGELVLSAPAETAIELNRRVAEAWKSAMDKGKDKTILLCDARLRAPLAQMLCRSLPMLPVVAYDEIVLPIETIAVTSNEMTIRNE